MKEIYTDYEMCKKWGGACCKQNGCVYDPKDFKNMDFSYIKRELEKGKISISGQATPLNNSSWTYIPYLRARNKDSDIVDLITNGGPYINLSKNGCTLPEEKRPTFRLLVKPTKIGGPCEKINSNSAINWLDYNEVLEKLVKYYKNKDIIDIIVEEISRKMIIIKRKIKNNVKLSAMEQANLYWYCEVMVNKSYYTPNEVKKMILL